MKRLSVLVIEPGDSPYGIGSALAGEEVLVECVVEVPDSHDADAVIIAAAALPAGGNPGLGDTPVLVVLDPGADASAHGGLPWVTWPIAGAALAAACRGLLPTDATPTVQARTPASGDSSVLYGEIVAAAAEALRRAGEGQGPDVAAVRLLAERVHSRLLRDNGLVNQALEPHEDSDMASHSANVAIISGKIGMGLAFGVEDIVRLIMAGIVHDIGMARLPEDLVHKPGRLEPDELEVLRTHPVLGAELLSEAEARHAWLATVILQEHERRQGQGYPAGLLSSAIDPLAQVVGLADVFEALSHPRTYRSPYTALEALEQVSEMKGEYFDPGMVAALVNEISAFPLDSYVQLSSGEIGQVVGTNPENILRPEVLVRWDSGWNPVAEPYSIDLASMPDVTVARALVEAELPIT